MLINYTSSSKITSINVYPLQKAIKDGSVSDEGQLLELTSGKM